MLYSSVVPSVVVVSGFWTLKLRLHVGGDQAMSANTRLHFPSRDLNFGRDGDR